jgi:hypothetical protein
MFEQLGGGGDKDDPGIREKAKFLIEHHSKEAIRLSDSLLCQIDKRLTELNEI